MELKAVREKLKFGRNIPHTGGFPSDSAITRPCNAGAAGEAGSIPGSGRAPGGGHGNPLQDSSLENPMDTGTWWAIVHRVAIVHRDSTEAT